MEQRMVYCRIRAGISCSDLAKHMGIHRDSYFQFEKRAERIHPQHFLLFCQATGADPSFVLYGSSPPPLVPLSGATIGQRLREYRDQTGLSARQFGYHIIGAKRNTSVSAWESGSTIPEMRSLLMIASAFSINAVSFLPLL